MIKALYFFIFIKLLLPSSLELYGTGERYDFISAAGLGMGASYHFSDDISGINPTSIATLYKSDLTRVSFSTSFLTNISGYKDKNINFSSFLFSFPLAKNKSLTFGLTPYTRADIRINELSGNMIGQSSSDFFPTLNYATKYHIYGGISNAFSAFSMQLNSKNSIALKFNHLFGSQLHSGKTILSDLDYTFENSSYDLDEYDSTYQIIFNNFSGFSIQLDWILELKNHQVALSAVAMGPIKIKHKVYYDLYEISDSDLRNYYNNYNFLSVESGDDLLQSNSHYSATMNEEIDSKNILSRINDYSMGYHYRFKNNGLIVEHRKKNLFKSDVMTRNGVNILNNNQPELHSYHVGVYQRYINSKINSWSAITIRIGGYYKKILSDGELEENDFYDVGLTFGLGMKFNDNLIDLGIKFGKLDHHLFEDQYYCRGILTVDIGERWFEKFGRD